MLVIVQWETQDMIQKMLKVYIRNFLTTNNINFNAFSSLFESNLFEVSDLAPLKLITMNRIRTVS